jgi:hypothetical protein
MVKKKSPPRFFHERFDIQLDGKDIKQKFVNRVKNQIFLNFADIEEDRRMQVYWNIANRLGRTFEIPNSSLYRFDHYVEYDFYRCLQAVEATYDALSAREDKIRLDLIISKILSESEIDLGLTWKNGIFMPKGAALLDQELVNDPLQWLKNQKYKDVYNPFSKGLSSFLKVGKNPELLPDVIRDMYEALEALSKIVTGRQSKDLTANREKFIKEIKATEPYKKILKEYIDYANEFRHAPRNGKPKPEPSESEVESFIYLTGLFIRLAITSISS